MAVVPPPSGDRTHRSVTIWAAISTLLLAGVVAAVYLLALGLGGSNPVDKPGPYGFGEGSLALLVAVLPGLLGTLVAFFVAGRVETLGLSPSDKIAAAVEQRLITSVFRPQFDNKMQLARCDLTVLTEAALTGHLQGAHTIKMMFLYERFWGDSYARHLRDWMERDDAARIFIYLPENTTTLTTILADRHGTDVVGFRHRVDDVRLKFNEALGPGQGRPGLLDRVHYGTVPAPGPSYSGYVFDSRRYDADGERIAGDRGAPVSVRVIARMYATNAMGGHSELPTFFADGGPFAEFVRRDMDAVHERQVRSFT